MRLEMTRRHYIGHLDELRDKVYNLAKEYNDAALASASEIERDRQKKTAKLFGDLAMRLFEDAAVTLKILEANEAAGIGEQEVFNFNGAEPALDAGDMNNPEPEPPAAAASEDAAVAEAIDNGDCDLNATKRKGGKGKKNGEKGGK